MKKQLRRRPPPLRMGQSAEWDGDVWTRIRPLGTIGHSYMRLKRESDGLTVTYTMEFVREQMKVEDRRTACS